MTLVLRTKPTFSRWWCNIPTLVINEKGLHWKRILQEKHILLIINIYRKCEKFINNFFWQIFDKLKSVDNIKRKICQELQKKSVSNYENKNVSINSVGKYYDLVHFFLHSPSSFFLPIQKKEHIPNKRDNLSLNKLNPSLQTVINFWENFY